MKRREFITLLGGAAAAWPVTARAQQPDQMRRIGVLMGYAESDLEAQAWVTAFVQGFKELGWIVGRRNALISAPVISAARADPIRPTTPVVMMMVCAAIRMILFLPKRGRFRLRDPT
jgi:hypothetical protein